MKRWVFLTIPLLFATGLAVIIVVAVTAFPVAAQQEMDRYLSRMIESGDRPLVQVVEVARAARPWNLTADMSTTSFGASWYFETNVVYCPQHQPATTPVGVGFMGPVSDTAAAPSVSALPYPPHEVWCVLLDDGQLLFLAQHRQEPHGLAWITHVGPTPPCTAELPSLLAALECKLDLPRQVGPGRARPPAAATRRCRR